ncbi:MAG: GNAT family N-acetyltransferase [Chloroflexi bacterium]|nr:GNAT family N-acetyltransferase [Chloroflexota bacterium]
MSWVNPVILTGQYVRLEPMTEAHVPALTEIGAGQDFWHFMLYGDMKTAEDMQNWVRDILSRAEKGTDQPFVAVHLASGRVAGATRYLNIMPRDRGLEIGGTWYGLDFQRTAVNTECKYLLLKHAFETLGAIRVQLKTDLRNERSQRAIERLGAVREGVLRNHMILPDGTIRHSVFYSILDSEWPAVKSRLEGWLKSSR